MRLGGCPRPLAATPRVRAQLCVFAQAVVGLRTRYDQQGRYPCHVFRKPVHARARILGIREADGSVASGCAGQAGRGLRNAGVFAPQLYGPPFLPLATAAAVTERIRLASGINVAAEIGDGVIGHPRWSIEWAIDRTAPEIEKALARSGPRRAEIEINLWPRAAPIPNESEAIEDARPTMAFYGG